MSTYYITEKQGLNSQRTSVQIEAGTLAEAKRQASRMQMFEGTVMVIAAENGAELAHKTNGKWVDTY